MSEEQYASEVLRIERYVIHRAGFLCPPACRGYAIWEAHVYAAIAFLTERLDALVYGVLAPSEPDTGQPHLDANIGRIAHDYK